MSVNFDFKGLNIERLREYEYQIRELTGTMLDSIANVTTQRTFANTVQPMINLETLTQAREGSIDYAKSYYPDKDLRDVATEIETDLQKFMIDQQQRMDVYNAFNEYDIETERSELTAEEIRFYKREMRGFRRAGLHLTDHKEEYIALQKELSEIKTKYAKNVNDENTTFEMTRAQLDGMPESWFNDDRLISKNDGSESKDVFKMTLKYPDVMPALKYCKNRETRRTLSLAFNNRCAKENTPLFTRAIIIRDRMAEIMGYATHADFSTEVKVVKNAKTAIDFIEGLNKLFTEPYRKDIATVLEFARNYKENPLDDTAIRSWDTSYYNRLYTESMCDINMEELRQYFPLDTVRDGIFKIYQKLLGLTFEEIKTDNVWHPSVKLFKVNDLHTGKLMGYFYLDMFPREGKYGHACASDFMHSCDMKKIDGSDSRRPCVISMICNFPENECIGFGDVQTFFHEFGHVMHEMCSQTQLSRFSGFGVEWDFVEAPSQMLENWCYQSEPLKLMSGHVKTGECVPQSLIEKLKKSKLVLTAYDNKRQFMFGIFDLRVHTQTFRDGGEGSGSSNFDPQKFWDETARDVLEIDLNEEPTVARFAAFTHLMGGYDAGYYGYKRAETYSANMFYSVFKDDCMSSQAGMRYRKLLLEPGSTKDGIELLRDFLGEEPNDKYFLMDKGLM